MRELPFLGRERIAALMWLYRLRRRSDRVSLYKWRAVADSLKLLLRGSPRAVSRLNPGLFIHAAILAQAQSTKAALIAAAMQADRLAALNHHVLVEARKWSFRRTLYENLEPLPLRLAGHL
jgi:hypothetical protein